jgi:phosphotransferase system HPr (HPr) family protein
MNGPLRRVVKVANPQGLHVRPAAAFAELAARFESRVRVSRADRDEVVNGKLWPELLLLSAEHGTPLVLEVDGADAPDALDALARILSSTFEDERSASNGAGHTPPAS